MGLGAARGLPGRLGGRRLRLGVQRARPAPLEPDPRLTSSRPRTRSTRCRCSTGEPAAARPAARSTGSSTPLLPPPCFGWSSARPARTARSACSWSPSPSWRRTGTSSSSPPRFPAPPAPKDSSVSTARGASSSARAPPLRRSTPSSPATSRSSPASPRARAYQDAVPPLSRCPGAVERRHRPACGGAADSGARMRLREALLAVRGGQWTGSRLPVGCQFILEQLFVPMVPAWGGTLGPACRAGCMRRTRFGAAPHASAPSRGERRSGPRPGHLPGANPGPARAGRLPGRASGPP
jgi:hypothetical protein